MSAEFRVLVTGGRDYSDRAWVNAALSEVHARRGPITLLIHGGATGADALAHRWAVKNGIACSVHPADWKTHGRAAGPIRNSAMLELEKPDLVIAFPGGRGTASLTRLAEARGIPVESA